MNIHVETQQKSMNLLNNVFIEALIEKCSMWHYFISKRVKILLLYKGYSKFLKRKYVALIDLSNRSAKIYANIFSIYKKISSKVKEVKLKYFLQKA